ncbi:MAG: deoxyribodipyrimidine photo-lyase [Candidatus Zipacnadales bacterium]
MIHETRVNPLRQGRMAQGRFVLYWMQQSQRAECNHALEYAIRQANELQLPVVVGFALTDAFPEANARHYVFMIEGLRETEAALAQRGIQLVVRQGSPPEVIAELAKEAALVVVDRGYLKVQRRWRKVLCRLVNDRPVIQVESDVIVPLEIVSTKEEFAARTIRPKIHRQLATYLIPLAETGVRRDSLGLNLGGIEITDIERLLAALDIDRSLVPQGKLRGGTAQAKRLLEEFVSKKLADYALLRNEPALDHVSHLSPYLHFGQISPLQVALEVSRRGRGEGVKVFLEELIVRRELSINFVQYNPAYDMYEGLPEWARRTLAEHAADQREVVYTLEELEQARTYDIYWNAAQTEMVVRGKMHNTMRMYWGKKLIEWSETPQEAFRRALYLNNRYELDGRDANSFAGVAWCFGKHDRPWKERAIFGTVRYMNARGLERKYDMKGYLEWVNALRGGQV